MHLPPRARGICRVALPFTLAGALVASGALAAGAATTNPNPDGLELANAQLSKQAATEGMVLLENQDHALPIAKSTNVALFGVGAYATVKGGTGSGDVNQRYTVNVRKGLENAGFAVTTSDAYWSAMTSAYDTKYPAGSGGLFGPAVDYSSVEQRLTSSSVQPTAATDTAVYVVARNSGEGADRSSGQGDYQLTDTEYDDIQLIGQTYRHVVVVLNVGGVVDTSFFKKINKAANDPDGGRPVDSLLLMSQAGEEGGNALAEVLDGDVTPSGKLTDTWASKYSYYPASDSFGNNDGNTTTEEYTEGIYVGYRYFDSFYKTLNASDPDSVVDYPFGFGLSYTDFAIDVQSVKADLKSVTVKAKVTNVGKTYSGKEVVEAYFSAPQNGLDKPYQELAGYAKTDDLAPGASQTVTISYDTTEMSSYDEAKAAYVMDQGDYLVRVGDSSRNTHVAAKLHLAGDLVTEQDHNELTDQALDSVLSSDPAAFYTYDGESQEIAAAPGTTLSTAGFKATQAASEYQQDVPVDSSSPYYGIDGDSISSVPVYLDPAQQDWEGTGAPYAPKTGETVRDVATSPSNTLFDVAKGTVTMDQFVAGLSVTQLANIVEGASTTGSTASAVGAAGYTTSSYEDLGIPGLTLSDGPAGLRLTQQINTTPKTYQYATAWPVGTALAQTWNRDLIQQVGEAVGKEMRAFGVSLWLAPGMNVHRDPLNGRNFEYYSEDPLATGLTAAAMTEGVQSIPGEGVTVKHFDGNEQEANRNAVNDVVDERGFREIELKGFEIAVKAAQPMAVMSSYNKVGGTYAAQNYDLLTDLLRGEWGYRGLVMTDWGGSHDAVATMYAGNDLIEPGGNPNDVITGSKLVAPTLDYNGLPAYSKFSYSAFNFTQYTWNLGSLVLAADGAKTVTTTVDSSTDLSKTPLSTATVNDGTATTTTPLEPYGTVAGAYKAVQDLLAGTALSAAQKAAVTVSDVQYQTAGDDTTPVVAYTVTIKGDDKAPTMRLGDLQRSAARVLTTAMQSPQFGQLASIKGVSGITVKPYDEQFTDLHHYVDVTKGKVVAAPSGPAPEVTVAATSSTTTGWYRGPVQVAVTLGDPDSAQAFVGVDGGELVAYTGPVTVAGDGEHQVRVFAVGDNGRSTNKELTVRIDGTKPTVSATSVANGRLTLKATDALSGVKSVQYSLDKGKTWKTYTSAVAIPGAPKAVSYRATDKAGNVSAAKSVTVQGVLTLSTPSISGTVAVGHKVSAKVTSHTAGASLSYQWKLNGKAVKGATTSSYTLPASAKGKHLTVTVTEKKSGYATVTKTSAAKTVKAGTLTLSTPSIKGTATTKHTVKASVARHTSGAKLSYQWKLNGKAVRGATKAGYTLPKSAKGKKVTVTVTEKKSGYTTITKTSGSKTVKK